MWWPVSTSLVSGYHNVIAISLDDVAHTAYRLRMFSKLLVRLAPLVLATLVGCDGAYSDLCLEADDCENGNQEDIDACIQGLETEEDVASLHGCDQEWDDLIDCALNNNDCDNDHFRIEDRCEDEEEDYGDCID